MIKYSKFIFKYCDKRMQTKAMFHSIYNMALHNHYELCRDLILMSHSVNNQRIGNTNVDIQIYIIQQLHNMRYVHFPKNIGFKQSQYSNNYMQIINYFLLLPQCLFRRNNATIEQERQTLLPEQRLLPSHLHLISSAFSEVTTMLIQQTNSMGVLFNKSSRLKNKHFHKKWDHNMRHDRRMPQENTESIILTTGIKMMDGKYAECKLLISKLKIWDVLKT